MVVSIPRIVIAGTGSGVGKTSITLGLVAALKRSGLKVRAFKTGPDYLDPTYLALASGIECYNLDGWMTGREYVRSLFARVSSDADIAVVEGAMGLFDAADPGGIEGSTAEIALWLDAPVLLVVNAHGLAGSIAAMAKGYAELLPGLRTAGIIANHCGSEKHAEILAEALRARGLPPLIGAVPRGALPALSSRHLGLMTADKGRLSDTMLDGLAQAIEKHVSMELSTASARAAGPFVTEDRDTPAVPAGPEVRVGVAYDEAFHFYYPDNLEALERAGCELVRFSPMRDQALPDGLDAAYFGGGYPEEHGAALSGNVSMLDSVRSFFHSDGAIYAECGGLMYLSQGIETLDGTRYPMAAVLPSWTRMLPRLKRLGYVEAELMRDSVIGSRGTRLRGHEFHYSELVGDPTLVGDWTHAYMMRYRRSDVPMPDGFQHGNCFAGYAHFHFGSAPGAVEWFADRMRERRIGR
ncbi:MAG: cobyrinate a,c-diamide synthase [Pseudomonadota bacterium]